MKGFICDGCGEVSCDWMEPPKDWLKVEVGGYRKLSNPVGSHYGLLDGHFCSIDCLTKWWELIVIKYDEIDDQSR